MRGHRPRNRMNGKIDGRMPAAVLSLAPCFNCLAVTLLAYQTACKQCPARCVVWSGIKEDLVGRYGHGGVAFTLADHCPFEIRERFGRHCGDDPLMKSKCPVAIKVIEHICDDEVERGLFERIGARDQRSIGIEEMLIHRLLTNAFEEIFIGLHHGVDLLEEWRGLLVFAANKGDGQAE